MEIHTPQFNVASLAERVRKGIAEAPAARRDISPRLAVSSPISDAGRAADISFPDRPKLALQPSFSPRKDNSYHVNDLLKYHDRSFIQNAYLAILKRGPDATGFTLFIESLRGGLLNKIDILARLRYSTEGRAKKVEVKGLFFPAAIRRCYRLPVLGYIFNLLVALARLPTTLRSQQQFESHVLAQQELIANHFNQAEAGLVVHLASFKNSQSEQNRRLGEVASKSEEVAAQVSSRVQALTDEIESLFQQLAEEIGSRARENSEETRVRFEELALLLNTYSCELKDNSRLLKAEIENLNTGLDRAFRDERQLRIETTLLGARVETLLDRAIAKASEPRKSNDIESNDIELFSDEKKHILDGFYLSLEDRFRGSRQDIINRLRIYLARLSPRDIGSAEMPVLDVACGRGEWLELLKEQGLEARGVDLNRVLVAQCKDRGLDVVEGELLQYLKDLPGESVGAITGFHIVEHLPLENLIQLLDETVRLLKPGGMVIFETPNPENVLVGSCNFYLDPTHRNPLPSQILSFLVESRGFGNVEILRLNPSDAEPIKGNTDVVRRFNEYFYGPMDYAVIGWKA